MKYNKNFIKELEQLSFHVNDHDDSPRPLNWQKIREYNNNKNGFHAEAFVNQEGQRVLVIAGTRITSIKDFYSDAQLIIRIPNQAEDAFQAYRNVKKRYGEEPVLVVGYSLGGSLAQIVCNETGANGVTFGAYGVKDIVKPKHTGQIVNFGNESDIVYKSNFNKHLGERYVIPDDDGLFKETLSIKHHMPNKIGDISKAVKAEDLGYQAINNSYVIDGYINKNFCDDSLLNPSNRIFYDHETRINDLDSANMNQFLEQYYDNDGRFPAKEDLDRRTRFGELIYVNNYIRSDGTKVSGYYRRFPVSTKK